MIEKAIIVAIWQEVWTICETNGTALSLLLLKWYSTQLTMTLLYKTSNYMALTTTFQQMPSLRNRHSIFKTMAAD